MSAAVPSSNRWILGARPRTLPAAVVPVAVGTACAAGVDGATWWRAVPALVVALALQVATNYVNDYADGVRGTDDARVGPVRLVASGLASPGEVKRAALLAFAVAGMAGAVLAVVVTPWLFVVGAVSMVAGWAYTGGPRPYGYLGLGEVFVFVFFGVVATAGTTFVVLEQLTWLSLYASLPVGCLPCALLVVNNLRDIPTDTVAGKRTLAVRLGDRRTRGLYVALLVVPYLLVPPFGLFGRPVAALALISVLIARRPLQRVIEGVRGPGLVVVLGETGRVQLVFGLLLAVGLAVPV
ncbi:MAG: 1,4-dihydroxy-2-naphthoate polyprenyltransferase [Acidimicrobiales bacterium]